MCPRRSATRAISATSENTRDIKSLILLAPVRLPLLMKSLTEIILSLLLSQPSSHLNDVYLEVQYIHYTTT